MWIESFQNLSLMNVLAQTPQPSTGDMLVQMVVPFALIFLVFYFLMWRPQGKQRAKHETFLKNLSTGDKVVTVGGIIGTIKSVDEKTVTLEVAKGTKMRVMRNRIKGSEEAMVSSGEQKAE